jgi:hypothetical protein
MQQAAWPYSNASEGATAHRAARILRSRGLIWCAADLGLAVASLLPKQLAHDTFRLLVLLLSLCETLIAANVCSVQDQTGLGLLVAGPNQTTAASDLLAGQEVFQPKRGQQSDLFWAPLSVTVAHSTW